MTAGDALGKIAMIGTKKTLISTASVFLLTACGKPASEGAAEPLLEPLAPAGWADAAADFIGADGEPTGHVVLTNGPRAGVLIRVDLEGLPQGWHGIHLHQVGDCSDHAEGFVASGGHVDPEDREHGLLNPNGPERADLPNVYAGADGRATAEIYNDMVALYPSEAAAAEAGPYPLFDEDGFAVVVHTGPDDHQTQPIGGAGARIACAAVRSGE